MINLPDRKEVEITRSSPPELIISNTSENNIQSISIRNAKDSYTVNLNQGVCFIENLENIKTLEDKFSSLKESTAEIVATQIVAENSNNLSVFGLDNPRATVSVKYNTNTLTLNIGADAPSSAGVYVSVNDESKVYLLPSEKTSIFFNEQTDFIDNQVTSGFIESNDNTKSVALTLEGTSRAVPIVIQSVPMETYSYYNITSPKLKSADSTEVSNLIEQLQNIKAEKAVLANPTEEQLAEYGLNQPYSKVTTEYDGNKLCLICSQPENDKIYLMNSDIPVIYQMSNLNQGWVTDEYKDIASKTIVSPAITSVSAFQVTFDNNSYKFILELNQNNDLEQVKYNDNIIDLENFKTFYSNVLTMRSREFTDEAFNGSPIMSYSFEYVDTSKPADQIDFYKSTDNNKFLISLNGACDSFENRDYIDKIKSDVAKVANSESVEAMQ